MARTNFPMWRSNVKDTMLQNFKRQWVTIFIFKRLALILHEKLLGQTFQCQSPRTKVKAWIIFSMSKSQNQGQKCLKMLCYLTLYVIISIFKRPALIQAENLHKTFSMSRLQHQANNSRMLKDYMLHNLMW